MELNLIKKKYLAKIKLLNNYNRHYYEKSKPKTSDQEFDILKKLNIKSLCFL